MLQIRYKLLGCVITITCNTSTPQIKEILGSVLTINGILAMMIAELPTELRIMNSSPTLGTFLMFLHFIVLVSV